jgi:hypothetical protein
MQIFGDLLMHQVEYLPITCLLEVNQQVVCLFTTLEILVEKGFRFLALVYQKAQVRLAAKLETL